MSAGAAAGGPQVRVAPWDSNLSPVPKPAAGGPRRTLALTVQYHGAPFHGFARQEGLATVQGSLEDALAKLYRRPVPTVCAGRTDAGVHARGQVVSFDVDDAELQARPPATLLRSLNALTPETVGVRQVRVAPDGFSARFDATAREYRYFFASGPVPPLVMRDFCWHVRGAAPDVDAMNAGAAHLLGEHDFKSFCLQASAEGKPTVRDLYACQVEPVRVAGDELLCLRVEGSGFLHSMVRTIAGTLLAVGRGKRGPDWVAGALAARDRRAAGECAPACGLVFWRVSYDGVEWPQQA